MAKIYVLSESQIQDIMNEACASDINLSSFTVKEELNPKFWINGKINSRVRIKLLDIVDDFLDDISLTWVKPTDIVFTGSLANYNWSRYSDIDVHIRFDFNKIYKKTDFIQDYFDSKTEIWKRQHTRLKIYGFPVELKVEDSGGNKNFCSSGEFSLKSNKWLKEPHNFDDVRYNKDYVKRKAAEYMNDIDRLEKKYKSLEPGTKESESVGKKLERIYKKMKSDRSSSLKRSGEMSSGNIIYKIIRRTGYLDRLWDIVNKSYDKFRTIKEGIGKKIVITGFRGDDDGLDKFTGPNIFFTNDPKTASFYAGNTDPDNDEQEPRLMPSGKKVYKAKITIHNPLTIDADGRYYTDIPIPGSLMDMIPTLKDWSDGSGLDHIIQSDVLADAVRELGKYDALIIKNVVEEPGRNCDDIVTFSNKGIKVLP